ncbi:hypothetical protein [Sphingomonas hankookensis]|uniref:hypothetical protein n=1 Tax=Sphingomonas hankookensis TaxID=563996 RepID=UPI003D3035DD
MTDTGHSYNNRAPNETRTGNWMQTQFGNQFWPLDPRPEDFDIREIAASLGKACRYAGHCFGFYSVAEHSVLVSQVVPPEFAMTALMHDATEAYLVDIPRPIKPYLQGYKEIEDRLWRAIAQRYGCHADMPQEVKDADNAVLLAEQQQIMAPSPAPWCVPGEAAKVRIAGYDYHTAGKLFLRRFRELDARSTRS